MLLCMVFALSRINRSYTILIFILFYIRTSVLKILLKFHISYLKYLLCFLYDFFELDELLELLLELVPELLLLLKLLEMLYF